MPKHIGICEDGETSKWSVATIFANSLNSLHEMTLTAAASARQTDRKPSIHEGRAGRERG